MPTVTALLWLAGCGGESGGSTDAGIAHDGSRGRSDIPIATPAEPTAPDLPTPPAPPSIECPDGWLAAQSPEGIRYCEPWEAEGPPACPAGEARFPGEAACRSPGRPCPSGDFPDDAPEDASYVLASADGTGSGTRDAPFTRVSVAIEAAPPGSTIIVGRGVYPEQVVHLSKDLTIRGACSADTVIEGTVIVGLVDAAMTDIQVRSGMAGGVLVAGMIRLEGVLIRDSVDGAVVADAGTHVELADVAVVGVRAGETAQALGIYTRGSLRANGLSVRAPMGLLAEGGSASIELHRAAFWSSDEGIRVLEGATLQAMELVAQGSSPEGIVVDGSGSRVTLLQGLVRSNAAQRTYGLTVTAGAVATLRSSAAIGGSAATLRAEGVGTRLELTDVFAVSTGSALEELEAALAVRGGADLSVNRVALEGSSAIGAHIFQSDATIMDLTVTHARGEGTAEMGGGLLVYDANVSVERVHTSHTHLFGVSMLDARGTLRDVRAEGVANGIQAHCVHVRGEMTVERVWAHDAPALGVLLLGPRTFAEHVTVERLSSAGQTNVGLFFRGDGELRYAKVDDVQQLGIMFAEASVTASDLSVNGVGTLAGLQGELGSGLFTTQTTAEVARLRVQGTARGGLDLRETDLTVSDLLVREIGGRGVQVHPGSNVTATRAHVEAAQELGVAAFGPDAVGTWQDLQVLGTRAACDSSCEGRVDGVGFAAYEGAHQRAERFRVADNVLLGVQVGASRDGGAPAQVDLRSGEVSGSRIGVAVQVDGYDLDRLTHQVAFRGNERNLDAVQLPVPSSAPPPDIEIELGR